MNNGNGRKLGNIIGVISIAITILTIFAGVVTSLSEAREANKMSKENRDQIISVRIEQAAYQQQVEAIDERLERMERKLDRVLEQSK